MNAHPGSGTSVKSKRAMLSLGRGVSIQQCLDDQWFFDSMEVLQLLFVDFDSRERQLFYQKLKIYKSLKVVIFTDFCQCYPIR